MPVIPSCVPVFHIRPPSTTNDNGNPTDSLTNDIHRVFALIDDERHLTALRLLDDLCTRLDDFEYDALEERSSLKAEASSTFIKKKKKSSFPSFKKQQDIHMRSSINGNILSGIQRDEINHVREILRARNEIIAKLEVRYYTYIDLLNSVIVALHVFSVLLVI